MNCEYNKCTRMATTSNMQYFPGKWYCTYHSNKAIKEGRIKRKLSKLKYLLILFLLTSCATSKHFTEKAYICYEVFQTSNGKVVHRFANLTLTEGRDFYFDSIYCQPMDTIIIKQYRKRTVFIKK